MGALRGSGLAMAKTRVTVQMEEGLAEKLRDAVVYLQRNGQSSTLSGLAGEAIESYLTEILMRHKRKSFPKRNTQLRPGRRIS